MAVPTAPDAIILALKPKAQHTHHTLSPALFGRERDKWVEEVEEEEEEEDEELEEVEAKEK